MCNRMVSPERALTVTALFRGGLLPLAERQCSIEVDMGDSENNSVILIIRPPNKVPLIFGNSHIGTQKAQHLQAQQSCRICREITVVIISRE